MTQDTKAMADLKAKVVAWLSGKSKWVWDRAAGVIVVVVLMQIIMNIPIVNDACHSSELAAQFCDVFIDVVRQLEAGLG